MPTHVLLTIETNSSELILYCIMGMSCVCIGLCVVCVYIVYK